MSDKVYVQIGNEKREATTSELEQLELDLQVSLAAAEIEAAQQSARSSALAKLAALGLTEAEIAAITN
jgi:hypothetical protein